MWAVSGHLVETEKSLLVAMQRGFRMQRLLITTCCWNDHLSTWALMNSHKTVKLSSGELHVLSKNGVNMEWLPAQPTGWDYWETRSWLPVELLSQTKKKISHLDIILEMSRRFNKMTVGGRAGGNAKLCEMYAINTTPIMSSPATVYEAYHSSFNNSFCITTVLKTKKYRYDNDPTSKF